MPVLRKARTSETDLGGYKNKQRYVYVWPCVTLFISAQKYAYTGTHRYVFGFAVLKKILLDKVE